MGRSLANKAVALAKNAHKANNLVFIKVYFVQPAGGLRVFWGLQRTGLAAQDLPIIEVQPPMGVGD
jgi:hypothetical protein